MKWTGGMKVRVRSYFELFLTDVDGIAFIACDGNIIVDDVAYDILIRDLPAGCYFTVS